MNKKVLIGLGLALVGIEVGRFTRLMDSVSATTKNLKLSMDGGKIVVKFQLDVTNNSSKDIYVNDVRGKLYIDNNFLASYRTQSSQVVAANSISVLPVMAILSDDDLASTIANFKLETSTLTAKTSATISFKVLGLLKIPINIKDETSVVAGGVLKDLNNYLKKWVNLFKK